MVGTDEQQAQRNRGKCLLRRLLRVLYGMIEWNTNWTGPSSVPVRGQVTF